MAKYNTIAIVQNGTVDNSDEPQSLLSDMTCQATPRGVYRGPSDAGKSRQRRRDPNSQYITSIRGIQLKEIVLTSRHGLLKTNDIVKKIVKDGSRITLLPYEKALIPKICMRSVFVCFDRESLKDEDYIKFIKLVTEEKLKDAGSDRKVQDFLSPKLMLLDGLTRDELPKELKSYHSISFSPEIFNAEKILEFIQGRFDEQDKKVEEAIEAANTGPLLHVFGKLKLLTTVRPDYLERSRSSLEEVLEDASSYPRQLLMQLYKLFNVRIIHAPSKKHTVDPNLQVAEIELRPIKVEPLIHFLKDCTEGTYTENIRNYIKVNGHPFMGQMDFEFKDKDLLTVMEKILPELVNHHHDMEKAINNKEWDEIARLLKLYQCSDSDHTDIPMLKHMAATNVYKAYLSKTNFTPYTFLKTMRSYCLEPLEGIRCPKGYNAMHLAIIYEREDFLKMLFYSNKWGTLYHDTVQPLDPTIHSSHKGYIPYRLAEALSFKSKGYEVLCEFERLNSIWRSMQPIMRACLSGSLDFVDKLVSRRQKVLELKDNSKSNCLFYACASGNVKLVSYLIAKNVPLHVQNDHEESVLHIAAMFGHTEILKVLSNKKFDIRGQRNKNGLTAIDYCAMNGDLDVLKLYNKLKFQIDPKALTLAARYKQSTIVEFMIDMANPNEGEDDEGRLAIHYEVINGNINTVQKLLDKGADPKVKDKYKKNVFHLAAEYCRPEVLDCLFNYPLSDQDINTMLRSRDTFLGKDLLYVVRGKDRGRKAWHWVELRRLSVNAFNAALHSGQIDVATYGRILKSGFGPGPDENTQDMMRKRTEDKCKEASPDMTPLHVAVLKSCEKIVQKLLEKGADPNLVDYIGATPIHYAAMTGKVEILSLLVDCGANLDVKTSDGKIPKMIADENLNALAANFIEAQPIMDKAKEFVDTSIANTAEQICPENLDFKRKCGDNIRRFLIGSLRDLTIDINQVLFDLGSGPILEESESTQQSDSATEPPKYQPTF